MNSVSSLSGEPVLVHTDTTPRIAVRHCGAGEFVLFLHGIGGNSLNWDAQLRALGTQYHAAAWDMRGYAASDDYEGAASFDAFAADVIAILDHFGVAKAHLCGLSIGGRVAQRVHALYPDRLASLILADTRSDAGETRTQEERDAFYNLRAKPILEGRTPFDIAEDIVSKITGPATPLDLKRQLMESMALVRGQSYLKAIRANLDDFYNGPAARYAIPVLVIVGADDKVTPLQLSKDLVADIPGSELVILPDAGHLSNMEQPAAFNEALLRFLTSASAAG